MGFRIGSLAVVVLLCAQLAHTDGFFMAKLDYSRLFDNLGATSTEQKGIVIEAAEGRQALLIQTTYHGPAADFAWVIPVPGEPGDDDVFIASSHFIDGVLKRTVPIVRTHIETPPPPERTRETLMEAYDLSEPGADTSLPTVTLHRRMEVGDYDVSVLSATGPEVLIDWLNEHGYATPEEHADLLGHYVDKAWYFVALRALRDVVEERPVLSDVKPIGIEFPTETLTYPLYISRGSSREQTALTLVALTREPVECENLAHVRIPLGEHGKGTSYARIRRETVGRHLGGPAAVLEYAGFGAAGAGALNWRDGEWPDPEQGDLRELWATRLWTIIGLDEMEDLTLIPAAVHGDRMVIERHGKLPEAATSETLRGMGMLHIPAWSLAGVVFLALVIGGIGARRVPLPLLYAALPLGAVGFVYAAWAPALQSSALPSLPLVALAAIIGFASMALSADGRLPQAVRGLVLTVLVLGAALSIAAVYRSFAVYAGKPDAGHNGLQELNSGLETLDKALQAFLEDTGSYPAALEDLTLLVAPHRAIDSSGNEVVVPETWNGPYLARLPVDPLTQSRDTWIYEVTGSPMIESGGLAITISRQDTPEPRQDEQVDLPVHPIRLGSGRALETLARSPEGRVMRFPRGETNAFAAWPEQQEFRRMWIEESDRLRLSLSPDGRRAAFAHRDDPAQIRLCDISPPDLPAEELDQEGTWVTGVRDLIGGYWPVAIHDLALHPNGELVAAVARIPREAIGAAGPAHLTRVYLVREGAAPEPVAGSDGCVQVEWSGEGELVGLFAELPVSPFRDLPSGTLKRILPDGRTAVLAHDVPHHRWLTRDGWVAAVSEEAGVVVTDSRGASMVIEAPEDGLIVDDLLIDGGELCVAWGPVVADRAVSSPVASDADIGVIRVYRLGDTAGTEVARYSRSVPDVRRPCRALLVGKDPSSGAWVIVLTSLATRTTDPRMTFAVWPDRSPQRLMDFSPL